MKNRKAKGFTLIELMIALAIIGILMTVAMPAYKRQMLDTRRSDGHNALLALANLQERFYLQNNTYAADIATLNPPNLVSPEGYYNLTTAGNAVNFTVTATADPAGPQANDGGCTTLNLTSASQKTPAQCW